MNLSLRSLFRMFLISLFASILLPFFQPFLLTYFAPFLVIYFYQKSYISSLWTALFCGLFVDFLHIFYLSTNLGLTALSFFFTTLILHPQRRHFFPYKATTLPLMTFLFALLSTIFQAILEATFHTHFSLSLGYFLTDFFLLPIADSIFAFAFFVFPFFFFGQRERKGSEYFLEN